MKNRGKWQGMLTIARFNWPFYVIALFVLIVAVFVFFATSQSEIRLFSFIGAMACSYFLIGSLGVSHLVYDRSDLYRWQWLDRALKGGKPRRIVFCHSGFDEASADLREKLPDCEWIILDHYDGSRMTEASIQRARKLFPPVAGTVAAAYKDWPVEAQSADVVFGLLAIHELRSEAERTDWFREARRSLKVGGRVIIVEHLRDLANFIAFGPGFLHFHSETSWRRSARAGGLQVLDEFRLTPWLRVFILSAA